MHKYWLLMAAATMTMGCAQPARYGMVEDPETGLMLGSAVERNIVIDAAQFENRTIKLNLRNASGDPSYDLTRFRQHMLEALRAKGYTPTEGDNYGIKFDVNVLYSGHIQQNMAGRYGFLGAAAGGAAGYRGGNEWRNATAGAVAGATLGAIAGSYVRDDTYITVAEVTVAVADQYRGTTKKTVTFSASPPLQEVVPSSVRPFEALLRTKVAVYAGGRNTAQRQVSDGVRERLVRIVADAI